MIRRIWEEKREYFNDEALIKSQHGFREFRIFGILVSRRDIDVDATIDSKKNSVGFNTK